MRFATISKATFWKRLNSVLLILPHDYERVHRPNDSLGPQTFPTFSVAPTVLVGHWPETQVIAKTLFWPMGSAMLSAMPNCSPTPSTVVSLAGVLCKRLWP